MSRRSLRRIGTSRYGSPGRSVSGSFLNSAETLCPVSTNVPRRHVADSPKFLRPSPYFAIGTVERIGMHRAAVFNVLLHRFTASRTRSHSGLQVRFLVFYSHRPGRSKSGVNLPPTRTRRTRHTLPAPRVRPRQPSRRYLHPGPAVVPAPRSARGPRCLPPEGPSV